MRGTWGVLGLLCLVTGLACHDKPKRILKQPDVQMYDLPPPDQLDKPPTYPEEKRPELQPKPKDDSTQPLGGMKGGGGGPPGGAPGGMPRGY